MAGLVKLAFLLHTVVELPAAFTFIFRPNVQLPNASPDAVLILRNYGGLLLATVGLSSAMYWRNSFDSVSQTVAFSLASYHVWPLARAVSRLRHNIGLEGQQGKTLGGPALAGALHAGLFAALIYAGFFGVSTAK
jgi:hypothetical protein